MRRALHPWIPWPLMLACLLAPAARAETSVPDKLTIEQAVAMGLEKSPRLRGADLEVQAAEAKRKSSRGHFGPILRFETRAMFFNEPPGLGGGGGMSEDEVNQLRALAGTDLFDNIMVDIFSELPSMFVSEKYDVNLSVSLIQPLSPLWAIYHVYKLNELEVDAARVTRERQESELAFQIRKTCLQILQAQAGIEALEGAVGTVEAHVERAEHFLEAGLISQSDLLQAKVQLDQLKLQVLTVRHGLRLGQAALSMLLDLPPEAEVAVVAPQATAPGAAPELDAATREAVAQRPELRELRLRIRQAELGVKASWQGFMPELSAMAMYQHNEGSIMTPPAWTGGVVLSWDLWEWGAKYYATEEAEAKLARARVGLEELERAIGLDVRQAWLQIAETAERITLADNTVAQAEERLRMERERYEVQQATSTEVLDAQNRLTAAEVERLTARYQHLVALAALDRATGLRSWERGEAQK